MSYLFHSNQFWRQIRTQKVKKTSNISKTSLTVALGRSLDRARRLVCFGKRKQTKIAKYRRFMKLNLTTYTLECIK